MYRINRIMRRLIRLSAFAHDFIGASAHRTNRATDHPIIGNRHGPKAIRKEDAPLAGCPVDRIIDAQMTAPHQLPRTNGRNSQVESWIFAPSSSLPPLAATSFAALAAHLIAAQRAASLFPSHRSAAGRDVVGARPQVRRYGAARGATSQSLVTYHQKP